MHHAMASQSSFAVKTKSFTTVDSLLPSELRPTVVGPQRETRLLDRLPVLPTSAPSIEYIRHTGTRVHRPSLPKARSNRNWCSIPTG